MGRLEEAEASLNRLKSKNAANVDVKSTLATIIYTDNLKQQLSIGTSYFDCFKGTELRRTEIACMCFAGQILCGICFAYNSSYFFSQVGLGTTATYSLALGGTGLAFIGCLVNWTVLMPRYGRRDVYVWGMGGKYKSPIPSSQHGRTLTGAGMCIILFIIGILNVWTDRHSVAMTQAILTLVWTFIFQLSAGQLGWHSPRKWASNITGLVGGMLQQYMMDPQAWDIRGYTGFIWGTTCLGMFIWSWFRLPETWNRTYHELDVLFEKRIPPRQFATAIADPLDTEDRTNELVAAAAKEAAKNVAWTGSIVAV
ncbi:hypothetical protein LTR62_003491 [Meristemomyces frigidus]|uniref:Uncharacterized protein n=1 Tax=Meristemomyces frigidus TaxID=1508187 RepID=A0AAN7TEY7_9PEZI|nr:hypothetical protein LTR62_003491 [Meristemomyces frigidus]